MECSFFKYNKKIHKKCINKTEVHTEHEYNKIKKIKDFQK
jgi:hypothetical protein